MAGATVLPVLLDNMRFISFDLSNLGNNIHTINGLSVGFDNVDQVALIKYIVNRAIETGCEVHEEVSGCDRFVVSQSGVYPSGQNLVG